MTHKRKQRSVYRKGFALPSILIASVVMLAVLVVAMQSAATTRTSLEAQYYNHLAQDAAESGVAMANACLKQNGFIVTWDDAKPLGPNTDCQGNVLVSCPTTLRDDRCGVDDDSLTRTSFAVGSPAGEGASRTITVSGKVDRYRRSNNNVWQTYDYQMRQLSVRQLDPSATRASQRWWFFGRATGIDFGTSGTTATSVDAPCVGTCVANEGVTTVSDVSGNLLFWTNGITVWNRQGNEMMNGGGLLGGGSTVQAAVSFPLGASGSRYGIVTNTAWNGGPPGALYFSVIDMSADSGRGAVVGTKNQALWPGQTGYPSEALAAAPKADGSGYWIVTYRPGTTNLLVFEVDANGLVAGSVREFSAGATLSRSSNATYTMGHGTINLNDDYSKLVILAGNHCTGSSTCSTEAGIVRLVDFDTKTGTPSNRFVWNNGTSLVTGFTTGYSADFSPNEEYIYTTTIYPGRLYRYKIAGASTDAAIKATEEGLAITNHLSDGSTYDGGGQVRKAPDGRMYAANNNSSAISVINNPNAPTTSGMTMAQRQAAIGWVYNGRPLTAGKISRFGLPQMATHYTPKRLMY